MLSCFLGTQSRQLLKRLFFPLDSLYSFLGERRAGCAAAIGRQAARARAERCRIAPTTAGTSHVICLPPVTVVDTWYMN
jgi:hypothetical protein